MGAVFKHDECLQLLAPERNSSHVKINYRHINEILIQGKKNCPPPALWLQPLRFLIFPSSCISAVSLFLPLPLRLFTERLIFQPLGEHILSGKHASFTSAQREGA